MSYEFFDHQADVGIIGIGKSYEQAFEAAAEAMFKIMCDTTKIKPLKTIRIDAQASDREALFIEWLNALLAQKDIEDLLFSEFKVKISKTKDGYKLTGTAKGEQLDPSKHRLQTEVKAATYAQLKVWKEKDLYKTRCVVDV